MIPELAWVNADDVNRMIAVSLFGDVFIGEEAAPVATHTTAPLVRRLMVPKGNERLVVPTRDRRLRTGQEKRRRTVGDT